MYVRSEIAEWKLRGEAGGGDVFSRPPKIAPEVMSVTSVRDGYLLLLPGQSFTIQNLYVATYSPIAAFCLRIMPDANSTEVRQVGISYSDFNGLARVLPPLISKVEDAEDTPSTAEYCVVGMPVESGDAATIKVRGFAISCPSDMPSVYVYWAVAYGASS